MFVEECAGTSRLNAGAVSKTTAQALTRRPELRGGDGVIGTGLALAVGERETYAGGSFTRAGGTFHLYAVALDAVTGALLAGVICRGSLIG